VLLPRSFLEGGRVLRLGPTTGPDTDHPGRPAGPGPDCWADGEARPVLRTPEPDLDLVQACVWPPPVEDTLAVQARALGWVQRSGWPMMSFHQWRLGQRTDVGVDGTGKGASPDPSWRPLTPWLGEGGAGLLGPSQPLLIVERTPDRAYDVVFEDRGGIGGPNPSGSTASGAASRATGRWWGERCSRRGWPSRVIDRDNRVGAI